MFYREASPPSDLVPFVMAYWEFAIAGGTPVPFVHHIFPDGCAMLAYSVQWTEGPLRLRVVGPTLRSRNVVLSPGNTTWGLRLQPVACRAVVGVAPAILRSKSVPCVDVNPDLADVLLPQLNACSSFEAAVGAYSRCLSTRDLKLNDLDPGAAQAARIIARGDDERIESVAAAVGLSVRQLERRFLSAVGITPKQFARTRRIRKIAVTLAETEQKSWATLAAEMGFADQAHLGHEFAALTGISPTSFKRRLRQIEHGELLK